MNADKKPKNFLNDFLICVYPRNQRLVFLFCTDTPILDADLRESFNGAFK